MKKISVITVLLLSFVLLSCSGSGKKESVDNDIDAVPDADSAETEDYEVTADDENSDSEEDPDEEVSDETSDGNEPEKDDSDGESEEKGCIAIDVPTITMAAYPDEINGFFSPELGDHTIDIIKIFLMGELEPGTYDLTTPQNKTYKNCQQCVMVWVDTELGEPKEAYFQTGGTLTITEVEGEDLDKRTNGYIENLTLGKAKYPSFTLIPGAEECITADYVEWNLITESEESDSASDETADDETQDSDNAGETNDDELQDTDIIDDNNEINDSDAE